MLLTQRIITSAIKNFYFECLKRLHIIKKKKFIAYQSLIIGEIYSNGHK